MPHIWYLTKGQVTLSIDGDDFGSHDPGKGGMLGEFYDPNTDHETEMAREHAWAVSMRATTDCRTLRFDRVKLREAIDNNKHIKSVHLYILCF